MSLGRRVVVIWRPACSKILGWLLTAFLPHVEEIKGPLKRKMIRALVVRFFFSLKTEIRKTE